MDGGDAVMARIGAAVEAAQAGDRDAAARAFAALWDEVGAGGDPLHRCTIAHHMADCQTDPAEELRWDLRALQAAGSLTDERARAHHAGLSVAGFFPSLHLNVADDYRRLGRTGEARDHLARARAALPDLPSDGYGRFVRGGIDRLAARLDGRELGPEAAP